MYLQRLFVLKKGIYEALVRWVLQHPNYPVLDCWSKAGNCPKHGVPREELAAPTWHLSPLTAS